MQEKLENDWTVTSFDTSKGLLCRFCIVPAKIEPRETICIERPLRMRKLKKN